MTLTLTINPELEERLGRAAAKQSLPVGEFAIQVLERHLPADDRSARLGVMLQSWMDENEAVEVDDLLCALDQDRLSERKLFPPELKGVTW